MKKIKEIYNYFRSGAESLQDFLLLALRLYWGSLFLLGGWHKLTHIPATAGFFESLNIPFANLNAHLVGYVEFIGGLLLIIGLFNRVIALPLIITLVVAYLTAHIDSVKVIFSNPSLFTSQSPFNYLLACLIIFAFGPGKISLDYLLSKYFGRK